MRLRRRVGRTGFEAPERGPQVVRLPARSSNRSRPMWNSHLSLVGCYDIPVREPESRALPPLRRPRYPCLSALARILRCVPRRYGGATEGHDDRPLAGQ